MTTRQIIKKATLSVTVVSMMVAGAMVFAAGGGFDQYGFNRNANIFNGTGSSWCQGKIGWSKATCDAYMYPNANDHLIMKWNDQWDNCNHHGYDTAAYCAGAWVDNEWNGNVPGGSGTSEHYKIIWVGSQGTQSSYWRQGGYSVWGNYEVIMDQGVFNGSHVWYAHASPSGY